MRVSLFATCLGDHFFASAVEDAVRVLRGLDVEVDLPWGQTCCGQPAHNAGHAPEARDVARHTVRVLAGSAPVVVPSGSCAAMLKTVVPHILAGDPLESEAHGLATRVRELSQLIVGDLGRTHLGRGIAGHRVAYHHGCHALRELGVKDEPLQLLTGAGAEVTDWVASEECCGFGGTFSVKMGSVSAAMADRKLDTLPPIDVLTSADPGCLMQLKGRAEARGREVPVRHLATVLLEAMDGSE